MAKEIEITMEELKSKIKNTTTFEEDTSTSGGSRIEAKDVKVWYDDFNAIKGIDMKIITDNLQSWADRIQVELAASINNVSGMSC